MAKSATKKKASSAHRRVQASTVRSRKTVQRNVCQKSIPEQEAPKIILRSDKRAEKPTKPVVRPEVKILSKKEVKLDTPKRATEKPKTERTSARENKPVVKTPAAVTPRKVTAKEQKDAAIQKAIAETKSIPEPRRRQSRERVHFGFRRVVLAMACATAAVFAIVYFVNQSTPNISLKVAAMQSGIDAKYPTYVPRDYSLSDITSENGKITLNFHNSATGESFTIIEEKSSWDSNALLTNYVRDAYGDDYSQIAEQGLTIYISGSNACWANGGVVYKLKTTSGSLTKKQIKAIAVSL